MVALALEELDRVMGGANLPIGPIGSGPTTVDGVRRRAGILDTLTPDEVSVGPASWNLPEKPWTGLLDWAGVPQSSQPGAAKR